MSEAQQAESNCGSGDLNPDGITTASPSSWCVCQFRHFRAALRTVHNGLSNALSVYGGSSRINKMRLEAQ